MSQKTAKKVRRRTDEETEGVTKKDLSKIEVVNQKNGSDCMNENEIKECSVKESVQSEVNGNDDKISANTRSHSTSQNKKDLPNLKRAVETNINKQEEIKNEEVKINEELDVKDVGKESKEGKKVEVVAAAGKMHVTVEEAEVKGRNEIETAAETVKTVRNEEQAGNENKGVVENDKKDDTENEHIELEPLVLEAEEADPELQFDEASDVESRKGSPIIRCKTRRSLTRNIPTPKTPKSFVDTNGEDSEGLDKQSTVTLSASENTDTESEKQPSEVQGNEVKETSGIAAKLYESFESVSNLSTKAVVGSDVTRNFDFSFSPFQDDECSTFLSMSKDRSVGETLRCLSSRRAIRPVKDYQKQLQQVNLEKVNKKLLLSPSRPSVERISGTKRKNHSKTPDNSKRFKPESPGLFSYISSPILSIKNHFTKADIPSSTPKLTGYKNKTVFDNPEVTKVCLDVGKDDVAEKKWCIMM